MIPVPCSRKHSFHIIMLTALGLIIGTVVGAQESDNGNSSTRSVEKSLDTNPYTGKQQPLGQIDVQQAEGFGDSSTVETMRSESGTQVQTQGSLGSRSTVRLRGATENKTLVLLDGVPLNSSFDSTFDFGSFLTPGLGSIDILKGSQSVLYGSSAMGGAVLMQSARGEEDPHLRTFFRGGTFTTLQEGIEASANLEWIDYRLGYMRTDQGDDFGHDSYDNNTAFGRFDIRPHENSEITIITRYYDAFKELPITTLFTGPTTADFVRDDNRQINKDFFFQSIKGESALLPWYRVSLQGAYLQDNFFIRDTPDPGGSPATEFTDADFDRWFLRNLHHFLLYPGYEAEIAYEFANDTITVFNSPLSEAAMTEQIGQDRDIHSAVTSFEMTAWNPFSMIIGARYDNYSDFGDRLSPNAVVSYRIEPDELEFRASFSRGFRAPSVRELAVPGFGNPNLSPETSMGGDISIIKGFLAEFIRTRLTYFLTDYNDLIAFDSNTLQFGNIQNSRAQGLEAESCAAADKILRVCVSYTFTDSQLQDEFGSEDPTPLISRHNITFDSSMQALDDLNVRLAIHYRSGQRVLGAGTFSFNDVNGQPIGTSSDGFVKIDLDARYRVVGKRSLWREVLLTLHTENLLDEAISEFPGFPNSGISILGGVEISLL